MSALLTRIRVPGRRDGKTGFMDRGDDLTRPAMVKTIRAYADSMREAVAAIDATADEDFEVDVVRGSVVQHHVRKVP